MLLAAGAEDSLGTPQGRRRLRDALPKVTSSWCAEWGTSFITRSPLSWDAPYDASPARCSCSDTGLQACSDLQALRIVDRNAQGPSCPLRAAEALVVRRTLRTSPTTCSA
ncbi:hypothetical protein [Nesterenkonia pannonica]|uniref:hypothetical protein n=1 Tax=Nesterenkonia pannonica TaxID=1548602 RepID=UPI002164DA8C|nr:hypothetical protein [Nesterenkonia pannonica]